MIRQKINLFPVEKIPSSLSSQRIKVMDNLVLLQTKREGGKDFLLGSQCERPSETPTKHHWLYG